MVAPTRTVPLATADTVMVVPEIEAVKLDSRVVAERELILVVRVIKKDRVPCVYDQNWLRVRAEVERRRSVEERRPARGRQGRKVSV